MKIVITSATIFESERISAELNKTTDDSDKHLQVSFHVSGVGMLASCYSITRVLLEQKVDLIIQVGIAGCFDANIPLGKVMIVKEDVVGDMGVEEDGEYKDLFDMKFQLDNDKPYKNKKLVNPWLRDYNLLQLDEVNGLTINEISTRQNRIAQLIQKYHPLIESMEGAALHYACLQVDVPFIQFRANSNYVGERNKKNWKLTEALENLSEVITRYLHALATRNSHSL